MNDNLKRMLIRLAVVAVVLAGAWIVERYGLDKPQAPPHHEVALPPTAKPVSSTKPATPQASPAAKPTTSAKAAPQAKPTTPTKPAVTPSSAVTSSSLIVKNLSLQDQDGRTIYKGDIDLHPTVERIAAGRTLRFSHDGSTFQNREGRLPREAPGYYREWVVPTPGEDGPGPQRLVTGEKGEVWYTADHYRSFRRIPYKLEVP